MAKATHAVARLIWERLEPDGVTLFQANRPAGWQDVFHLHVHVVPRWHGDNLLRPWGLSSSGRSRIDQVAERLGAEGRLERGLADVRQLPVERPPRRRVTDPVYLRFGRSGPPRPGRALGIAPSRSGARHPVARAVVPRAAPRERVTRAPYPRPSRRREHTDRRVRHEPSCSVVGATEPVVSRFVIRFGAVAHAISVRLDDEAERALRVLEAAGMSRSEAIRSSLIASARRLRQSSALAAEVAALEADDADREEMLAVAELMESMRAPG